MPDASYRYLQSGLIWSSGIELRYKAAPAGFGIWVKKDSPIKTIDDLKGKKIAVGGLTSRC